MNGGSSFAPSFSTSASASSNRRNYRQTESSTDITMMDSNNGDDSYSSAAAAAQDQLGEYWKDDFRPLRDAGKNVLKMLRRDETSVHGDLYRRIMSTNPAGRIGVGNGTMNGGTSSKIAAVNDNDSNPAHRYFPSEEAENNSSSDSNDTDIDVVGPIKHNQTIPLPPYLLEMRSKAKVSILMGLFPEAELAWMTTDDTVYLWTYHQNSGNANGIRSGGGVDNQFLEFRIPSRQPIVSVGLAPPKKGAFPFDLVSTNHSNRTNHGWGGVDNIIMIVHSSFTSYLLPYGMAVIYVRMPLRLTVVILSLIIFRSLSRGGRMVSRCDHERRSYALRYRKGDRKDRRW
jgi:hypothetical protein